MIIILIRLSGKAIVVVLQFGAEGIVHWMDHFGSVLLLPGRPSATVVGRVGVARWSFMGICQILPTCLSSTTVSRLVFGVHNGAENKCGAQGDMCRL